MNLITSNVQTMSSREIAKLTHKRHDNVMRTVNDLAHKDIILPQIEEALSPNNNQPQLVAMLSKRDSLVLVARLSPEFTARIVDRWQELEQKEQFKIPQTLPEALQLAADLALKIEQDKPKIEYHDAVLATDNGITTTEIASELGMSAIKLNRLLESLRVQRRVGGRWVLTAAHLDQGLTVEVTHVDDGGKSRHSMKWTEAGRKLIHELVKG